MGVVGCNATGNQARQDAGFRFVELLAKEVSTGKLEIPGFPDVVMRIRAALDSADCDTTTLATLVGAEPILTARLLRLANSAALRPSSSPVKDPRTAINRLGLSLMRSITMAFAVEQMRIAHKYETARKQFDAVWEVSTHVGALAYVLAKHCTKINPDEALLVGLMHAIGKLYILSRAQDYPELFRDGADLQSTLDEWHIPVGEAVLQNWCMAEDVVRAVASQADVERETESSGDLTDVLIVAVPLAPVLDEHVATLAVLEHTRASTRLGVPEESCVQLLEEAHDQIEQLRQALGSD